MRRAAAPTESRIALRAPVQRRLKTTASDWPGSQVAQQPRRQSFNDRRTRSRGIAWAAPAIMVYFSFLVGTVVLVLHGLDLAIGWPFHQASLIYDIVSLIGGTTLAYLSWRVYREYKKHGWAADKLVMPAKHRMEKSGF